MNAKSLVSVIVPFYNEEKYIEKCLDSVKKQTYSHIELIVVDDGSTDTSAKLAKRYADIFLFQKHSGPGIARNIAAKIAKGDILIFIDADMYLDENYVDMIIKPILKKNIHATFTKEEYVANKENIWAKCFQIDNDLSFENRIKKNHGNISIRFRAIEKKIFFKTQQYLIKNGYGEDKVLAKKDSVFAPGAICYHYNPDSLYEIFISARWMGRSVELKKAFKNILRYSFINSFLISFKKIIRGAPWQFLIYKLVFDFGILSGILFKNPKNNYAK